MRTFAEWLRARSDDELRALLVARPDLSQPVPTDLDALANRAAVQSSVTRALDRLDRFTLQVLEALLVLSAPAYAELRGSFPDVDDETLRGTVDHLCGLALVWGDDEALRVSGGVSQAIVSPAGLGPPVRVAFRDHPPLRLRHLLLDLGLEPAADPDAAVDALADHLARQDAVDALLADAGEVAREVLDRLTWGPAVGRVDDALREVRVATAVSPIDRLLARGLLAAVGVDTVVLPREVAMRLRGDRLFQRVEPKPPSLDARRCEPGLAETTAAGQAFTVTRAAEELLELWSVDAPAVLRGGGVGVRELRRTARDLDTTEEVAALLVEVAHAAGLLAASAGDEGDWLPTHAYDTWRAQPVERRWTTLAAAWLETTRVPALVGERDERGRLANALGPYGDRAGAPEVRRRVLDTLASLPPGTTPSADGVAARLAWLRPRRQSRLRDRLVGWTLREAEALGVTGLGALSTHGRLLRDGDTGGAGAALAPLLPEPVDHVLLQADMTAVAPGPLTQELTRELALAADVESKGGATVYRFTPGSVRRALDAGRGADDLLALLERHSRTPVPQPLRYLVGDVARRHGRVRVGTASAYLRCDDPATLDELLADRRASALGLHRLAPTVLASRASRAGLLEALRAMGYAPVPESPAGDVLVTRPDSRRAAPRRRQPHLVAESPPPDEGLAGAAVRALRAGDRAATAAVRPAEGGSPATPPRSSAMRTVAVLQSVSGTGRHVWIGYLDAQGRASSRIVEPVRVEGGYLTAYDTTRAQVHRFALHRITGVADPEKDDEETA